MKTLGGEPVEIRATGFDEEGYMVDAGLQEVNISYHCFDRHCQLGQTGYSAQAPGRYALITSLPIGCANPIIEAKKSGYLPVKDQLIGNRLDLEMLKLSKLDIAVKKHYYRTGVGYQETVELGPGDHISIYLKLRDQPSRLEQYKVFEFGQNTTEFIELADTDAQYDIDVMLHNYDRFVGGYKAKNITIEYNDFQGENEIVLHVFEFRPRPIESNDVFQMMTYYMGSTYKAQLKPTFR